MVYFANRPNVLANFRLNTSNHTFLNIVFQILSAAIILLIVFNGKNKKSLK